MSANLMSCRSDVSITRCLREDENARHSCAKPSSRLENSSPQRAHENFADLTTLLADWTGSGAAGSPEAALGEAVPEPSGLVLAVVAVFGLSVVSRRGRRAAQ